MSNTVVNLASFTEDQLLAELRRRNVLFASLTARQLDTAVRTAGELHDGGEMSDLSETQKATLDLCAQLYRQDMGIDVDGEY